MCHESECYLKKGKDDFFIYFFFFGVVEILLWISGAGQV